MGKKAVFKGQRELMDFLFIFLILQLLVCCLQEMDFNVVS